MQPSGLPTGFFASPPATTQSHLSHFSGNHNSAFHQIQPPYLFNRSSIAENNPQMVVNPQNQQQLSDSESSYSQIPENNNGGAIGSSLLVRSLFPNDYSSLAGGYGNNGVASHQLFMGNFNGSRRSPDQRDAQMSSLESMQLQSQSQLVGEAFGPSAGYSLSGVTSPVESKLFNSITSPGTPGACSICHDRATGKHYGANSCDGCKGFFRRTVRKHQQYSCRFNRDCTIDRDKRNSCRYCRFKKCLHAGMRKDAVQNERDRIMSKRQTAGAIAGRISESPSRHSSAGSLATGSRNPSRASTPMREPSYQDYIEILMRAEAYYTASQLRATVITRTADRMPSPRVITSSPSGAETETTATNDQREVSASPPIATMLDISDSMHQQLLLMVEWAKTLSMFYELSMDDQIALLRNYAAQHLLICVAYRSRNVKDYLLLTNVTCLPREISQEIPDVNHVTVRILDELVQPMNELNIDETEFVCLRAMIFFNPHAKGLSDGQGHIQETRQGVLCALQHHAASKSPLESCRLGNLLLLLPPLQAIAQNLIEDVQLASMFGMTRIDSLLNELLLAGVETDSASGWKSRARLWNWYLDAQSRHEKTNMKIQ